MADNLKYNIGLDIGTSSVGWCVTDEENNIVKKSGKHLWGSRLFDEGQTAAETRTFRGTRRRTERRKNRIRYLQSMLLEDIEKVDENFIPRLQQSNLIKDDKNQFKFNLFEDEEFIDKEYYSEYPTIYHLRNALVNEDKKFDIRLVYLALHHIIKYRGNFLIKGNLSDETNAVNSDLENIIEYLKENEIELKYPIEKIKEKLVNKELTKSEKAKEILSLFDYEKEDKQIIDNLFKAVVGLKFNLNAIFDLEDERKLEFASDNDCDSIAGELNENAEIFYSMKNIYSWIIVESFLDYEDNPDEKEDKTISKAFVIKYDKYHEDLDKLKKVYKKYLNIQQYNKMFRKYESGNYYSYNGKLSEIKKSEKCSNEELCERIKEDLKGFEDKSDVSEIFNDISNENFLIKLNTTDNGEIPYQLHEKELKKILENQSRYYNNIKENKDKILSLLTFRIPYYVGPLSKNSKWAWVKTNSKEAIRPWNFDEIVDKDATAEEFIRRMTNKCTYLLNEDVIPKESLLYTKYSVLNEVNNIEVNEKRISKDMKFKILEIFKSKRSVSAKDIKNLYSKDGILVEKIKGFTTKECKFNSNMKSYIDFSKIIGNVEENNDMIEELIYWITIFEDKSILKRKIEQKYSDKLSEEQINKIVKLKYAGWSRLSKKLLIGLKSTENNETIIEKLMNTNMNFMQIITSDKFGFKEQLEQALKDVIGEEKKKISYDDIAEIQTSPANKKGIWQAILVVKEITKIMKHDPENIYIEFARSDEEKGILTTKKLEKVKKIYDEIENFKQANKALYEDIRKHQGDKNINERLYLYFIQCGKCLYSDTKLDIEKLSLYQIDHIIPQSYKKDDSIENKALVLSSENQRKKDSYLLTDEIIRKMTPTWNYLLDKGLISEIKYKKLIKRKMFSNEEEEVNFIARQLVETRQITKHIRGLLSKAYPKTKIQGIKATITHDFRSKYKIYKIRELNDCHHAQDAYIMCIVGNVLNAADFFEYERMKIFLKNRKKKTAEERNEQLKEEHGAIMSIIQNKIDINKVKEIINYKDYLVTRKLEEQTGEFYNQNLLKKIDEPKIKSKTNKDTLKYGGYTNENEAYFVVYEYYNKKGNKEYQLLGIPIKYSYDIKNGKTTIDEYVKNIAKLQEQTFIRILKEKMLKNQAYLNEFNENELLTSSKEYKNAKQLYLNTKEIEKMYIVLDSKNKKQLKQEEIEANSIEIYEILLNKIKKEFKTFNTFDKKKEYEKLDLKDRRNVIINLLRLVNRNHGDLRKIGLSDREGRKRNNSGFNKKKLDNMTFIDQSVTGFYERRYRIDELANSNNKKTM